MILAADNLTAADPRVAEALERLDPKPLQALARRLEAAGARWLDLNPGYLSRRREDRMSFLVEAVQAVTKLPLILDSPSARVLARGLAACRRQAILSALTLEERKLAEILPLAAAHQTELVLLLLDERSFPPPEAEGKIALAVVLRERALAAGLGEAQLIYDPVVPNLSWPDAWRQAGEALKAVRWLAGGQVFGEPARTMAGISNLRSGLRKQYPIHLETQFLAMLAGAGLDIALADALRPEIRETLGLIRSLVS
jgi:5-methyltetrahydrofolate corrinoid/iron sulfur protein methyltransferase